MTIETAPSAPFYSSLAADPDLGELVDLFVSELPERVKTLQLALEGSDLESLGRFAHQLKGAAGSYGFHQLTPALKQLESSARTRQSEETIRLSFQEVVAVCQRVRSGVPT